jgi:hypothetical protein
MSAKITSRGAPRDVRREGYKGLLYRGLYIIFSLLDTLKPFLIILLIKLLTSSTSGLGIVKKINNGTVYTSTFSVN